MPDEERKPEWEPASADGRLSRREVLAAGLGALAGLAAGAAAVTLTRREGRDPHGAELDLGDAGSLYTRIERDREPVMTDETTNLAIVTWDPQVPGALDTYGPSSTGPGNAVLDDRRGLMALYRRDPHLGCRVQWCRSSQWFENPCHGERYNRWGEWVGGPAPRGLDRFTSWVDGGGRMVVDLAHYVVGPARDRRILDQEPAGPHCVDV